MTGSRAERSSHTTWFLFSLTTFGALGCQGAIGGPDGGVADDGSAPVADQPSLRDPAAEHCTGLEAGRSPLRRLTREEYANTIRDLLKVNNSASIAAAFASDEKLGVFNANAVTPITNLRVEQYAAAAESAAAAAVGSIAELLAPCSVAVDGEDQCAGEFIERFGRQAYRRPLGQDELAAYQTLYTTNKERADFSMGMQVVIEAMLQSPNFLYHAELGDEATDTGELRALDAWQLASRLSYFLWSSMPDEELMAAAEAGSLLDPTQLAHHAQRMLDDPRADATIASFHRQWLRIEDLATLEKDAMVYPAFNETLRDAMQTETERFANYVIREGGGRLDTLLTAPFSLLEEPLFELYDVVPPAGHDPLDPIDLDPTKRAGILTQASLMARNAHANQTSPVHRGKLVREAFLCQSLPAPPADVNTTPPAPSEDATTRERFAQHNLDPACSGCHQLMDPIGLGFEHYDGIGTYRSTEADLAIDATGEIIATDFTNGTFDGAVELAQLLAQSDEVRECVARQWFRFAVRRVEGPGDGCSIAQAFEPFVASNFNIRDLMLAITKSDAFRHRRMTPTAEETP